jgi:hypothetical protein
MLKITIPAQMLLFTTVLMGSQTQDLDFINGMAYLKGEKGVTMETRTMPNCPYEKCSEIVSKDGTHTFSFAHKNYSLAVSNLHNSVIKAKNPEAAKELLNFLQRRLNWKEPKQDGYLISKLKEDVNIDPSTYKKYFRESVDLLVKNNSCEGYVAAGDIAENACFGEPYDLKKAKAMYEKAVDICAKDSYLGMTYAQKLKDINNAAK